VDSSVGPRALSVALIAPSQGGSPIDAILRAPSFGLVRAPGSPASEPTPSVPDVIVVDLTAARSASDPAAAELVRAAHEAAQRARAPVVMIAEPRVFPPESAMSDGVRGYVSPSDIEFTLAASVRAVHARHRIDEELRRKEVQLQNLLKETDHAFFAVDPSGICTETSDTELEMLGYKSRDEIIGRPMIETHWAVPEHYHDFMDRLRAQGHLKSYKMLFKKRGGREIIWVQGNCRLERDALGRPVQIHGIYRDVTVGYTQQLYQRALSMMAKTRRDEADPDAPTDEIPARADAIPSLVARTIYHTAVARAVLFLVLDREADVLVVHHAEGLSDDLRRRIEGSAAPLAAFPLGVTSALRNQPSPLFADLALDPAESVAVIPMASPGAGEPSSYVCILGRHIPPEGGEPMARLTEFLTDAAGHLAMAVALQKNRLFRAGPNEASGDQAGRRRVDDFLSHLLRALRDEVRFEGGAIFRMVHGGRKAKLRTAAVLGVFEVPLAREIALDVGDDPPSGASGNEERTRRIRRAWEVALKAHEPYHSGRKTWVNVPVRSPDGSLVGILHAVGRHHSLKTLHPFRFAPWDVEIFKAAAEQAEIVVSLLSAEERRSDLLARVTHEIRAPVNTIRANLDVLRRRPHDDAQFEQKRADIDLEAEVLLDLARKLDGLFGPPRALPKISDAVDVEPLLLAVIRQMEPDFRERGFPRSEVEVSLRAFPRVRMPLADLKQVFFNLFRNALLYADVSSTPKFRIRVVSNLSQQRPVIYFRDWGIGIVEAERERIFEAGVRGSNVQEVQARGTGLGLAICRQILGDSGASIAVTNLQKPTELTIEFPPHAVEAS
jgi:PAS domain S-box-containing protein